MSETVPTAGCAKAARMRRPIVYALVGLLAFTPLVSGSISTGRTLARTGIPIAPINETEPETEDHEAKLALRANVRWSPPGPVRTKAIRLFPCPSFLIPARPDRTSSAKSPLDGPRLRC